MASDDRGLAAQAPLAAWTTGKALRQSCHLVAVPLGLESRHHHFRVAGPSRCGKRSACGSHRWRGWPRRGWPRRGWRAARTQHRGGLCAPVRQWDRPTRTPVDPRPLASPGAGAFACTRLTTWAKWHRDRDLRTKVAVVSFRCHNAVGFPSGRVRHSSLLFPARQLHVDSHVVTRLNTELQHPPPPHQLVSCPAVRSGPCASTRDRVQRLGWTLASGVCVSASGWGLY